MIISRNIKNFTKVGRNAVVWSQTMATWCYTNITNADLAKEIASGCCQLKVSLQWLSLFCQTRVGVKETAKYELVSGPVQRDEEVVKRDVNSRASRYWSTWNGSLVSRKCKIRRRSNDSIIENSLNTETNARVLRRLAVT